MKFLLISIMASFFSLNVFAADIKAGRYTDPFLVAGIIGGTYYYDNLVDSQCPTKLLSFKNNQAAVMVHKVVALNVQAQADEGQALLIFRLEFSGDVPSQTSIRCKVTRY